MLELINQEGGSGTEHARNLNLSIFGETFKPIFSQPEQNPKTKLLCGVLQGPRCHYDLQLWRFIKS